MVLVYGNTAGAVCAQALRLQLALGARIGEVAGMHAQEIERQKWTWTLPPERSKNARARVTPLVGLAKQIVEERLGAVKDGYLFTTEDGSPLNSNQVSSILVKHRKKTPIEHFTSHDLRRTVASQLVELGFPYDLVAAVLGHEGGNKDVRTLIRHYIRTDVLDRKEIALTSWDAALRQAIGKSGSGTQALFFKPGPGARF